MQCAHRVPFHSVPHCTLSLLGVRYCDDAALHRQSAFQSLCVGAVIKSLVEAQSTRMPSMNEKLNRGSAT